MQTPFRAYYTARCLENLPDEDKLVSVLTSSDIKVYPFQVAAASFALRSPYQRGKSDTLRRGRHGQFVLSVEEIETI